MKQLKILELCLLYDKFAYNKAMNSAPFLRNSAAPAKAGVERDVRLQEGG